MVVAVILTSVVIAEKASTYERGAEKTGAETEAAKTRRATLDARIVGGQQRWLIREASVRKN
jgi:hypothetical protein